ncbi:DNA-directed RNA polymerase II core subunit rpo21 [Marasmius tenuissimus]|uniref:DNA-directed RNA polymerase II core subunit rpo21 n=1 Tax=Marasmius tenuissimus TaxID=585030 RepID=A0ABR2ZF63_9AGAR
MFARRFAVQTIPEKRVVMMQKSPRKGTMVAVTYSLLRKEGLRRHALTHMLTEVQEGKYLQPDERLMTPSEVHTTSKKIIAVDGGVMRSEDDLPYKLGGTIEASANIRRCEQESAPAHVISEFEQLL